MTSEISNLCQAGIFPNKYLILRVAMGADLQHIMKFPLTYWGMAIWMCIPPVALSHLRKTSLKKSPHKVIHICTYLHTYIHIHFVNPEHISNNRWIWNKSEKYNTQHKNSTKHNTETVQIQSKKNKCKR